MLAVPAVDEAPGARRESSAASAMRAGNAPGAPCESNAASGRPRSRSWRTRSRAARPPGLKAEGTARFRRRRASRRPNLPTIVSVAFALGPAS